MKKRKSIICLLVAMAMLLQLSAFQVSADSEPWADAFQAILESTNMYGEAGGFEGRDLVGDGWMESGTGSMEITSKQAYDGEYSSLHKITQAAAYYYKSLSGFEANKTYITSAMVLGTEANTDLDPNYNTQWAQKFNHHLAVSWSTTPVVEAWAPKLNDMNTAPLSSQEEQEKLPKEAWTEIWKVFTTGDSAPAAVAPAITPILAGAEFYVDNYYCGELIVADIINSTPSDSALIPASGESTMSLSAKALNQLGTEAGLSESEFSWEIKDGPVSGITLDRNVLTVTSEAQPQDLILTITCNPTFLGAETQSEEQMAYRTKDVVITVKEASRDEILENLRRSTNMYGEDGSFENKEPSNDGWIKGGRTGSMERSSKQAYDGEYSSVMTSQTAGDYFYKSLSGFMADKTYISSAMLLGTEKNTELDPYYNTQWATKFLTGLVGGGTRKTSWEPYVNDMNTAPLGSEENQEKFPKEAWTRAWQIFTTSSSSNIGPKIAMNLAGIEVYADDYYCGELLVADVKNTTEEDELVIPITGEKSLTLTAEALNQLETTAGLEDSDYVWQIKGDIPLGVALEENVLKINNEATEQELNISVTCNPVFLGADSQSEEQKQFRTKDIVISLKADSKASNEPTVKNISVEGNIAAGSTLNLDYDFWQINGRTDDASVIKWYKSDFENGPWTPFNEGNISYTILPGEEAMFFKVGIVPKTENAPVYTGEEVFSAVLVRPEAPTASDVKISGIRAVGEEWKAEFTFNDRNGDEKGVCTYRWLRADSENGEYADIEGETSETYTIKETDVNKYIKVSVTPVSQAEPTTGEEVFSQPVLAATQATVAELKVVKNAGNVLVASYEYVHPLSIAEGESICEWYDGEKLIAEGNSVNAAGYDGKIITLKVTPVAEKMPYIGITSTVDYTMKTSYSGSGGGGGGGGGGFTSLKVKDPEIYEKSEAVEPLPPAILINVPSWAKNAVDFVTSQEFMNTLKDNDFGGDSKINRAEFLQVILKTAGIEETAYENGFADVTKDAPYSKLLQSAVNYGIISKAENFYPERNLARDEMCKILVETMKTVLKAELPSMSAERFEDNESIMQWAVKYVEAALGTGLVIGVSETEFSPRGDVTRAQTAVLAQRMATYINEKGGVNK